VCVCAAFADVTEVNGESRVSVADRQRLVLPLSGAKVVLWLVSDVPRDDPNSRSAQRPGVYSDGVVILFSSTGAGVSAGGSGFYAAIRSSDASLRLTVCARRIAGQGLMEAK
jgi:hypothetical protein